MAEKIFIGGGESPLWLDLSVANRHGLIAGATGTGKTVSLRVLAEGFSAAGVPVFMADVKGDLGGLAKPGETSPRIAERAAKLKLDWQGAGLPVVFWDLFGRQGHPVRATVSDIGPILLARMLGLTDVQEGVLNVAFRYADDEGLLLLDLKDLRALISYVGENANQLNSRYGAVASSSVGAIQRALLALENQGADSFFGEPALDFADLMMVAPDGRGAVNVLAADELMKSPALYATFLLWMLSELFESLPEVGDVAKPKLVFFFDEAHLLFNDAPTALVTQVEQVVRLIRSKGVGVYFVTQSPGYPGNRLGSAWSPHPTRLARLHTARPEGGAGGGGNLPPQSAPGHRPGHSGIGQGGSLGIAAGRRRHSRNGATGIDRPAGHFAQRPGGRPAPTGHGRKSGQG